jgi:deoxyribose-phosphate aldolase
MPLDRPLARYIDQTVLTPTAGEEEIRSGALAAREAGFAAFCISGWLVPAAAEVLQGSQTAAAAVVGFPLGFQQTPVKAFEAGRAVEDGAREIDMVVNRGLLRQGDGARLRDEIRAVVESSGRAAVKAILETSDLAAGEILRACDLAVEAGAAFVKTSTGFFGAGADEDTVRLIRERVGLRAGVKASGGIRTLDQALLLIRSGADRLGSSSGLEILAEWSAFRSAD